MKPSPVFVAVGLLLLSGAASLTQTRPGNPVAPARTHSSIVEKLRAIVDIRQTMAEANARALQNGKGDFDGRHEIALAEAQMRLAHELGQTDAEVAALKDILKVHQRRLQEAKTRAEVGATSPAEVDLVRVEILETEVRLLRAQADLTRF